MQDAYRHCEALVREADHDRFLATLFAPADRRRHLHALYAFDVEIARVGQVVHEALAGEIRLQWWREALAGRTPDQVAAHPVASAFTATIAQCALPIDPLEHLIDAHARDLYDDPLSSIDELVEHGRQTASTMFDFAARILDRETDVAAVAAPAGAAATLTARLQGAAHRRASTIAAADLAARARAELEQVRRHWGDVAAAARPAFLPLALVQAVLARSARTGDSGVPIVLSPWRRQWALWRAARRGAF
ncbi:MAG TPA: squalene/phytoene synthase family protein [Xanthobacteraceae bacterium]|nr:squalene/phytoene synthase family protein [Xanthobacteraceae bacterium]